MDPTVDTWRNATLPLLRKAGIPADGLELKIIKRGAVRARLRLPPPARAACVQGTCRYVATLTFAQLSSLIALKQSCPLS